MKKFNLYVVLLIIIVSCKQKNLSTNITEDSTNKSKLVTNNQEKEAVEFLEDFYTNYFGEEYPTNRESIQNYVSKRFLERIDSLTSDGENLILDYNPFIKGQDFDYITLKSTLKVEPLKDRNEYRVSFLRFGAKDEKRTSIDYLLKKNENGRFLIYSILNDDFFNFKTNSDLINLNSINNENKLGELIFNKVDKHLVINEKLLSEIEKQSNIDHGKTASILRSYVNELINNRNNNIKLIYTDSELYKLIAYTINTVDPIYYKYYDENNVFWGKYSIGRDSRGGASFSDALSIGKLLSIEELDNMTKQFRLNNFYNLPNLENMLEETVWY